MYLSPLSPVLNQVLTYSEKERIPYLHTTEASALKKFFQEKVIQSLLHRKKTLIVIPDSMSSAIPAKLLTAPKLAHFSLHLSKEGSISDQQMERLKMLSRLQEINTHSSSYKSLRNQKKEIESRIETSLNSIHHPTEKGPSLKSIILDEVDRPVDYISPELQRSLSTISLDHETLSLIHRLQQGYQKHYAFMDHQCSVLESAFQDHDHIAQAQDKLITSSESIREIIKSINSELSNTRQALSQKIEIEILAWNKVKEELQLAIFDHEALDKMSSFEEVYSNIIANASQFKYLHVDYVRQPSLNWGEALIVVEAIDKMLSKSDSFINEAFNAYLDRLTPYNLSGSQLHDNFVRGESLLRSINNIPFLNVKTPKRYFQVSNIIADIKLVAKQIDLALETMMDAGYCHYRELAIRAGLSEDLRISLTGLKTSNWRDTIKYFASQVQINNFYNPNINRLQEDYKELQKTSSKIHNTCIEEIHNLWCRIRNSSVSELKNEHWNLYQSIWVDSNYKEDSLSLFKSLGEVLLSFCPLSTVHESELSEIISSDHFYFDQVIFFESRNVEIQVLQSLPIKSENILILSSYNIQFPDTDRSVKILLSTDMNVPGQALSTYNNSSDKYRHAVAIAGHLIDLIDTASIFRWKDQLVLSFVDEKINDHLVSHLNVQAHHFLYRSTLEIGHIVEALLADRPKLLIGENNLLNDRSCDSVLWQTHLIRAMSEIEIETLSIDTDALYKDKGQAFRTIEQQLMQRVSPTIIPITTGTQLVVAL